MATVSTYIPLADRELWQGVTPILQDDGPSPLVPIMYSEEYKDAMDHFRALSASQEMSERGLELTESIIRMNPAHYTVWGFRMATLLALKKDLEEELELMNEFARENLKSYQVWHHRLLLLTHLSPIHPTTEIQSIHTSLLPDPKNYHTWAYLHWLYSHFSSLGRISPKEWEEEVEWCSEMLRVDGRNNSAWGWRWFLMIGRVGAPGFADQGKGEIEYAIKAIHKIPHNASAWNYLRGLITHFKLPLTPILTSILPYTAPLATLLPIPATQETTLYPLPTEPLPADTPLPIPLALEFLGDALAEQRRVDEAGLVFERLGSEFDRIRAGYWEFRRREVLGL